MSRKPTRPVSLGPGRAERGLWVLALFLVLACHEPRTTESWTGWRGGERNGISTGTSLPSHWGPGSENIRWKTEVPGIGNSSPVSGQGMVFVTYAHRQASEQKPTPISPKQNPWRSVMAIDQKSGEPVWRNDLFQAKSEGIHPENTLAAPTPILDETGVYVFFGSVVLKLGLESGEVVWEQEVDETYREVSHWGAASSPALSADSVIVLRDGEVAGTEDVGWLTALDRSSGEVRWRVLLPMFCCTYTSPLVVDRGTGEEIWVAHSGALISYSADSGEELWSWPYLINQMVGTPVVDGNLVAIAGGAHNVRNNVVLELDGSGSRTRITQLWEDARLAPQNSSPVVVAGTMYSVTDKGILTARELRSGEVQRSVRLEGSNYLSSLVAGDEKLYAQSTSGLVSVLELSPELNVIAVNDLDVPGSNASPAVAGGCLLVRTKRYLFCIEGGER